MRDRSAVLQRLQRPVRNEDGATLIFFGLLFVALFACFVIAVDVGSALNARSEAQRTADAAALAGAGLFKSLAPGLTSMQIRALTHDTAFAFARRNYVGWQNADSVRIYRPTDHDNKRVGVEVFGRAPIFFAPFIGIISVPVYAYAEARVDGAASTDCVKPFAVPDMWNSATAPSRPRYVQSEAAHWTWNSGTSTYIPWDGDVNSTNTTGWGSASRNVTGVHLNDIGRRLVVKRGNQDVAANAIDAPVHMVPSDFYGLVLSNDTRSIPGVTASQCQSPASASNGGDMFRTNICRCNNAEISIGDQMRTEPGSMIGPTSYSIDALMAAGPAVSWVQTSDGRGYVALNAGGARVDSHPRIFKSIVYNPNEATPGRNEITVTNIGIFFLEGFANQGNVIARFMMYADGTGSGGAGTGTGSLMRSLQLVPRTLTSANSTVNTFSP